MGDFAIMCRPALAILLIVAIVAPARAATWYVANNGVDGTGCGLKGSPCRSIGQAVNFSAAAGDTVIVGPGTYGDLNQNGVLGDAPGEETGGFGCMVLMAQAVTLTSSDGAGATIIDAHTVSIGCNVGIAADGALFGKPGKGFTVTGTGSTTGIGIQLAATNVTVSGNQVIGSQAVGSSDVGIDTGDNPNTVLITGNQVVRWNTGIQANGSGKTVRKNQVSQSRFYGISSGDGAPDISGNVITDNGIAGLVLSGGSASVSRNTIYGNANHGIFAHTPFSGTIEQNDIFGNRYCGVQNGSTGNTGVTGLDAKNNYWGAATGPGPDPADDVSGTCNFNGGSTTVTPFATKPFSVKAPVKF